MKLKENLRALRLKRGLTQEKMADVFDVSPQAISRWENGNTCPDVQMLPIIATYFDVSLDFLLGVNEMRDHKAIAAIYTQVHRLEKSGDFTGARKVLRQALKQYPKDYGFMTELTLAIAMDGQADDQDLNHAVDLCLEVLDNSVEDKLRSTAKANLCYLYGRLGNREESIKTGRSLPHIWEARELILPELVSERDYDQVLKEGLVKTIELVYEKITFTRLEKIHKASQFLAHGQRQFEEVDLADKINAIKSYLT